MDYCMLLKYSSADKCYIVSVPDLPGCMADGKCKNCDEGMDGDSKGSREKNSGTSIWAG